VIHHQGVSPKGKATAKTARDLSLTGALIAVKEDLDGSPFLAFIVSAREPKAVVGRDGNVTVGNRANLVDPADDLRAVAIVASSRGKGIVLAFLPLGRIEDPQKADKSGDEGTDQDHR
jgi:hypothetical protein